jgi:hypothetical protein
MTNKQFLEEKCKIYNKINGRLLNPHLIKNMNYNDFYIAKPICNEIAKWNETSCDASRIHNFIDVGVPSPNANNIITLVNSNDLQKIIRSIDFCFKIIYETKYIHFDKKYSLFFKFYNIYIEMLSLFIKKNYSIWNENMTKESKECAIISMVYESLHYSLCIFSKYPTSIELIYEIKTSLDYEDKCDDTIHEFFLKNISYSYLFDCTYSNYIEQTDIIEWKCFDDKESCDNFGGTIKSIVCYLCFLHSLTFKKQTYESILLFQELARIIFKNVDVMKNFNNDDDDIPFTLFDLAPKNHKLFSLTKKLTNVHGKLKYSTKIFSSGTFLNVYHCFSNIQKIINNVDINTNNIANDEIIVINATNDINIKNDTIIDDDIIIVNDVIIANDTTNENGNDAINRNIVINTTHVEIVNTENINNDTYNNVALVANVNKVNNEKKTSKKSRKNRKNKNVNVNKK